MSRVLTVAGCIKLGGLERMVRETRRGCGRVKWTWATDAIGAVQLVHNGHNWKIELEKLQNIRARKN